MENRELPAYLVNLMVSPSTHCASLCFDFADSCSLSFSCSYFCFDFCFWKVISATKTPRPDLHSPLALAHKQSRLRDCGILCRRASSQHTSCPRGASTRQRPSRLWRRRRSRRHLLPSCGPSGPASFRWMEGRWLSHGTGICDTSV